MLLATIDMLLQKSETMGENFDRENREVETGGKTGNRGHQPSLGKEVKSGTGLAISAHQICRFE